MPRVDEGNPFGGFVNDANDVDEPIQLDNPGINDRDLFNTSLKLDFGVGDGTLTSVTHYNTTEEILTGDAFDFRPAPNSLFFAIFGFDLNQSQFLDIESYSQEIRYTSPTEGRFRWIAAPISFTPTVSSRQATTWMTAPACSRSIASRGSASTTRVQPSSPTSRTTTPGRSSPTRPSKSATRSNSTRRYATTRTSAKTRRSRRRASCRSARRRASSGQVRTHTWSEPQPKLTLRYEPTENTTIYGGLSRGFRSGGFNQTGVGAVADANGVLGVNDLFEAEVADTAEIGVKSQLLDGRLNLGAAAFYTESENGYFFVFLAANSTQNLGNLDARYKGFELEMNWNATDNFDIYASYGYTDSDITDMEDPTVIGNEAPLVSRMTGNVGRAVHRAGRGAGPVVPRRLPPHGTHLVGAVQHDFPRPDRHRRRAHRARRRTAGPRPSGART